MNNWAEVSSFQYLLAIVEHRDFGLPQNTFTHPNPISAFQARQFQEAFGTGPHLQYSAPVT
jgi:hypothetical protein